MSKHGWHGHYGRQEAIDPELYAKWVDGERTRMRDLMRKRRADAAIRRKGEPAYPEPLLAFMARWTDAHRNPSADAALGEIVALMRKAARVEGVADYDRLQDRGIARYFRANGFVLRRESSGMAVIGVKVG